MIVACPQCGEKVTWDPNNRFRPFCSERCKQLDLGAWAHEKYVITGSSIDDDKPDADQ